MLHFGTAFCSSSTQNISRWLPEAHHWLMHSVLLVLACCRGVASVHRVQSPVDASLREIVQANSNDALASLLLAISPATTSRTAGQYLKDCTKSLRPLPCVMMPSTEAEESPAKPTGGAAPGGAEQAPPRKLDEFGRPIMNQQISRKIPKEANLFQPVSNDMRKKLIRESASLGADPNRKNPLLGVIAGVAVFVLLGALASGSLGI
mmetsp:Transcript_91754/g.145111  ORF Transcript_91754/g.145111 Transcript_91754/m.145111 type:complete len:206 (-) Transcript_91754:65-682(-)